MGGRVTLWKEHFRDGSDVSEVVMPGLGNLGKGREFPSLKAGAPNSWSDATKSLSHFPDLRSLGQLYFLVFALPSTS